MKTMMKREGRSARALWFALMLAAAALVWMGCERGGEHDHAEGEGDAAHAHAEADAEGEEAAAAEEGAEAAADAHAGHEHDVHDHGDHGHDHGDHDHAHHGHEHDGHAHDHGDAAAQADAPAMGADHETIEVDESEIVAQPGASMGDAARCPVSGEPFRVRETSPSAQHEGETWYFCCGSCVRPFMRDPAQYL